MVKKYRELALGALQHPTEDWPIVNQLAEAVLTLDHRADELWQSSTEIHFREVELRRYKAMWEDLRREFVDTDRAEKGEDWLELCMEIIEAKHTPKEDR